MNWVSIISNIGLLLFGANTSSKLMLFIVNWTLRNKLEWNFGTKIQNVSFTNNASENIVCEMAAIWSRGRWVKYHSELSPKMKWSLYDYKIINISSLVVNLTDGFLFLNTYTTTKSYIVFNDMYLFSKAKYLLTESVPASFDKRSMIVSNVPFCFFLSCYSSSITTESTI